VDKASLELLLSQGLSLGEIGKRFGRDPSTVGYWVRKHGLQAANRDRHLPKGAPAREEVERLLAEGASIAKIARTLERSESSVKHWLDKWGLRTSQSVRRERAVEARRAGLAMTKLVCRHHGLTDFWLEGRGSYRCLKCRGEWVARRRRKVKQILVAEAGGECRICGYDRCVTALQFHHLDPETKNFTLSYRGLTRSIAEMRSETAKCILVCANCHAEVEAGIVDVGEIPERAA
jgi:transposase-like protein